MPDTKGLRRHDAQNRIIHEVRRAGSLGRAELVHRTGLPRSSLFAIVGDLVESGVLVESSPEAPQRGRGRPGSLISLNPASGVIAGVDIGRSRTRAVLADMTHQIVASGVDRHPAPASVEARARRVEALIRRICEAHDVDPLSCKAIGLGIYGHSRERAGSPDRSRELCENLSRRLEAPVTADNNTRLAALAEATWGAGRGVDDQVYVRWSTGVGGGYLLGGRLRLGSHGLAGEVGHVCVDPDGPACECGGHGCLERLIAGPVLLEECRVRGLDLDDLDALVESVQARVGIACDVIEHAALLLGQVLAGTVVQLDPERVILGGELGRLGTIVGDAVGMQIDRLAAPALGRQVDVVQADLGADDGAMGAVAHVLHSGQADDDPHRAMRPSGLAD